MLAIYSDDFQRHTDDINYIQHNWCISFEFEVQLYAAISCTEALPAFIRIFSKPSSQGLAPNSCDNNTQNIANCELIISMSGLVFFFIPGSGGGQTENKIVFTPTGLKWNETFFNVCHDIKDFFFFPHFQCLCTSLNNVV
jgi:hypothetical protein